MFSHLTECEATEMTLVVITLPNSCPVITASIRRFSPATPRSGMSSIVLFSLLSRSRNIPCISGTTLWRHRPNLFLNTHLLYGIQWRSHTSTWEPWGPITSRGYTTDNNNYHGFFAEGGQGFR